MSILPTVIKSDTPTQSFPQPTLFIWLINSEYYITEIRLPNSVMHCIRDQTLHSHHFNAAILYLWLIIKERQSKIITLEFSEYLRNGVLFPALIFKMREGCSRDEGLWDA